MQNLLQAGGQQGMYLQEPILLSSLFKPHERVPYVPNAPEKPPLPYLARKGGEGKARDTVFISTVAGTPD